MFLDKIALILAIIGGLNWGSIGIFRFDIVAALFGGPANTTATITQYLYTYGIKSLDFGFGSAGAIIMTILVLILSSVYIKRAIG